MSKRVLIHTNFIGGHQLEYIHHFYLGAIKHQENVYIIVAPKRFDTDSKTLEWPEANNIQVVTYDTPPLMNEGLRTTYHNAKLLGRLVRKYNADEVVVVSLMEYMPFLPLFVSRKVRVKGIIYRIYLYDWETEGLAKKIKDGLIYTIFSKFRVFHEVYMLNDNSAATYLCKLFHTPKYKYLPDPVPLLPEYSGRIIREELGISSDKLVLLHPGGMLPYKGTINILKAVEQLNDKYCENLTIVFAGRASAVQPEFSIRLEKIQNKIQTLFLEGYLPFEKIADLFASCDYVLIPYTTNNKSSGIIGNASFYSKPVVVAKGGVIGKMVRKWKLGYMLPTHSVNSIREFLENIPAPKEYNNSYAADHTIEQFVRVVLG